LKSKTPVVLPPITPREKTEQPAGGHRTSLLKRRWLLNVALLLLIGALIWATSHHGGREKNAHTTPLTTLSTTDISQIRIERPAQPVIALDKTGESWRLTAPLPARVNRFNIESLLRTLSAPAETRIPAVTGELAKFGLDKPQSRIWIDDAAIAFGAMHPLTSQIYVLYKDEVVLIPAHYLATAAYPYTNFIDSRLFEENRKLVALQLPGFSLTLKDGVWRQHPADQTLTTDQVNDFVASWQNTSALRIEKYSNEQEIGKIVLTTLLDKKEVKLHLGILAYKPEFILFRPDENLNYHFTEQAGLRLLNLKPD
jgi:hypothetical protein